MSRRKRGASRGAPEDVRRAEADENRVRLDFSPSDMVAVAAYFEAEEKAKAREREKEGGREKGSGKLPDPSKGRARDALAARVGTSGRTLEKAKAVVEAAKAEPECYVSAVLKRFEQIDLPKREVAATPDDGPQLSARELRDKEPGAWRPGRRRYVPPELLYQGEQKDAASDDDEQEARELERAALQESIVNASRLEDDAAEMQEWRHSPAAAPLTTASGPRLVHELLLAPRRSRRRTPFQIGVELGLEDGKRLAEAARGVMMDILIASRAFSGRDQKIYWGVLAERSTRSELAAEYGISCQMVDKIIARIEIYLKRYLPQKGKRSVGVLLGIGAKKDEHGCGG